MTLGQFSRAVEGYTKRLEVEAKQTDQLNHILGQYLAAGVNDLKHYPKQPLLSTKRERYTAETFQQIAKRRWGKK